MIIRASRTEEYKSMNTRLMCADPGTFLFLKDGLASAVWVKGKDSVWRCHRRGLESITSSSERLATLAAWVEDYSLS